MEQLENFQKKLWLKKKFVVETNYCITLDSIPKEFHKEIFENKEQLAEWKKLGFIAKKDHANANNLLIDTKFYSSEFKHRLIATIPNLDESLDGLLIHSENFQALNLLQEKYREAVDGIHIDPPYNTATSGFLYKNNYQRSSWMTMMFNRIISSAKFLENSGVYISHIDENEYESLFFLFNQIELANSGTMVWDKKNPMLGRKGIATQHEYILWRSNLQTPIYMRNKTILEILNQAKKIIDKFDGINDESRKNFSKWISSQENLTGGEKAYRFLDDDGNVYRGVAMGAPEYRTDKKFHIPLKHPITKKECPVPSNGWSRTPETLAELITRNEILWGNDHTTQPQKKVFLTEDSNRQISSIIQDAKSGKVFLDNLGMAFPYSHPVTLYNELLGTITTTSKSYITILDYFAGSGTTGHAVINLNREDGGNRKYILVEMGEYFDTVLKPRIQKVVYAPTWKDGKPVLDEEQKLIDTEKASGKLGHAFKYIRLESYEDTLNNLVLPESEKKGKQSLPFANREEREEYMLKYFLDLETKESPSLLKIDSFSNPFDYQMKIIRNNEIHTETIDLVETFNYLIGLVAEKYSEQKTIEKQEGKAKAKFIVQTLVGRNRKEERVLVVWRTIPDEIVLANISLKEFLKENFKLKDFDRIYINGDSTIEGALLLEEHFKNAMFDVQDM